MSEDFAYDVYLSYSQVDAAWVRGELLTRLQQAGLNVCIDVNDFVAGAPRAEEFERAITTSKQTVLVLTPAYLNSEWNSFGNLMVQTLDPTNQQRRLLPLIKEPCDLPTRLSMLTPVNFADPDSAPYVWRQLLTALGVQPEPEEVAQPTAADWHLAHPYPMQPNFTGRKGERATLTTWLNAGKEPLLVLRALGGFGKSALSWYWLTHDIDPHTWPHVVFWSFYEGDASFDKFLSETLSYLSGGQATNAQGRPAVDALIRHLQQPGTLLILDGFERQLRAFSGMNAAYQGDETLTPPQPSPVRGGSRDLVNETTVPSPSEAARGGLGRGQDLDCISPLAEHFLRSLATLPTIRAKVLMTTRLRPRVLDHHNALLEGCREVELRQLHPADARVFFQGLGIRGSRAELEGAGAPYGYHPLSLRLLAGLVQNDFLLPGDIAAAQRLNIHGDLVQQQHHVLEHAYSTLAPARRQLLSHIACFRFGVEYAALQALAAETGNPNLDTDLRDLLARGLVQRDRQSNRFDLHPIVRHYAYDRLAPATRESVHRVLIVYFEAVPAVERPRTLDDLQPLIELYHHMVRSGQYDAAFRLFRDRIDRPTYYQLAAYQLQIELLRILFPDSEDCLPQLQDESTQGSVLNDLALVYSLSGQPRRAMPLFEQQIAIKEKQGNIRSVAIGLGNLAHMSQLPTGALRNAAANMRRRIDFCREIVDEYVEAAGHQDLGRLLAYCGEWEEAREELAKSAAYWERTDDAQGLCLNEVYWAMLGLLRLRDSELPLRPRNGTVASSMASPFSSVEHRQGENPGMILVAALHALELANETAHTRFVVERDYIDAHWLLGAAHRINHDLDAAEHHLTEALTRCRSINSIEFEADILLDLARLRWALRQALRPAQDEAQGPSPEADALQIEALTLAQEALVITERSGYVLQGADVHLFLAEAALAAGERAAAREHATQARNLAYCDGPPYSYKVAYDEAVALLAQLDGHG